MTTLPESILALKPSINLRMHNTFDAGYGSGFDAARRAAANLAAATPVVDHPRETTAVVVHETPNVSDKPATPEKRCPWPDCPHGAECVHAIPVPEAGSVEAEPVAWRWRFLASPDKTWRHCAALPYFDPNVVEGEPLFAHPPATPLVKLEALFREAIWRGQATSQGEHEWREAKARQFAARALSASKTGAGGGV